MAGSTRVPVEGPLGPFVDGFVACLVEQGHSHRSVLGHVRRVRHMSCWMMAEGLGVAQLTPMMVERFLAERRRQGQAVMISPSRMVRSSSSERILAALMRCTQ